MTIHKYPLPVPRCSLELPAGAKILHVAMKDDRPCLWVLVDPTGPGETRRFLIYGTGTEIPDLQNKEYVATVLDDPYVWHVFEEVSRDEPLGLGPENG